MKPFIRLISFFLLASLPLFATPTPTTAPDLDASYDSSGLNGTDTDNITNFTSMSFSGSKASNETITLYINDVSTGVIDSNTGTTYTLYVTGVVEGYSTITVRADDGSGESLSSPSLGLTVDTIASISFTQVYPLVNNDPTFSTSYTESGYFVSVSTDVESNSTISIYDGATLKYTDTIPLTGYMFIPESSLSSLVDGNSYTFNTQSGLSDIAGNVAVVDTYPFIYDKTGNDNGNAKSITVGVDLAENIYDTNDIDYFVFEMPSKGQLTLSSGNANVYLELLTLNDLNLTAPLSSNIQVLNVGSYLIRATSDINASYYTLNTSIIEYEDEIDAASIPRAINKSAISLGYIGAANDMHSDGENLYISTGYTYQIQNATLGVGSYFSYDFFIKDGSFVFTSGATGVTVQNILNAAYQEIPLNSPVSVSRVANELYVLEYDVSASATLRIFDISDLNAISETTTTAIFLPILSNLSTYTSIMVYKEGVNTYLYALDATRAFYIFDISNTASITLEKSIQSASVGINDFDIDNDLFFLSTDQGVYVYSIKDDPVNPKYMSKTDVASQAISTHGGKLYVNEGTELYSYDISYDYDDSVINASTLSKMNLDSNVTMNKMSAKADVDIFRFDLEYSGTLTLTSSGVNASDLNITVDDNADFLTPFLSSTSFKNLTKTLADLSAKTYYVKITSTDINSFDEYTLTNSFTKNSSTDVKDALLNLSISSDTAITLGSTINSSLGVSGNDVDLYKIDLESDGELSIASTGIITLGLYTTDVNTSSSYASLSEVNSSNPVSAGTYYIQVSGIGGSYSFTPSFTSYGDKDEYALSVSSSLASISSLYPSPSALDMSNGFVNTPASNYIQNNYLSLVQDIDDKIYLSQVNDGKYIYALYIQTGELGLDVYEYINDANIIFVSNTIFSTTVDDTFAYKLKYINSKILMRDTSAWFELDVSTPTNITKISTAYLDVSYIDLEMYNAKMYAVDGSNLDVFAISDLTQVLLNKPILDVTSLEVFDNLVYVGTSTSGIKVFDVTTLSQVKSISYIQNVINLERKSNTLYVLGADVYGTSNLVVINLEKDFGNDFANAQLISQDKSVTAIISSSSDHDFFMIDMDATGSIITTLTSGVSCALYSENNLSALVGTNCTSATVVAGRYYLDINSSSITPYSVKVSHSLYNSDEQDTLSFYEGSTDNLSDASVDYNGTIDVVGDVDYFKIIVDTTGLLVLSNINATLVYENGDLVAGSSGSGGGYDLSVSGEYFIKVTGSSTGTYGVNASFTSIIVEEFIDNTSDENTIIASISLNGNYSKILSSGSIVYLVDEVDGLSVINISDAQNPIITSRVNLEGIPQKLYLDGSILYVALGLDGFAIIDVSDANASFLYSQTVVNDTVLSIVANARNVFLGCEYTMKKYDISTPTSPLQVKSVTFSSSDDIILYDEGKLLVASVSSLSVLSQSTLVKDENKSITMSDPDIIVSDSEYIFVLDDTNVISIYDNDLEDTFVDINITGTVKDLYLNNKILYVSKDNGYEVIEYNDLENIASSTLLSSANSISVTNDVLVFAKPGEFIISELIPDYTDTLISSNINLIDISDSVKTTGQFSKTSDIDSFKYINVDYTGTLEINVTAPNDVNISLYDENKNLLVSSVTGNTLKSVINSGIKYIQINAITPSEKFSYEFSHTFTTDGTLDIIDESYANEELYGTDTLSNNLYASGYDKDYFKLVISQRGNVSFTSDNDKVKISILYKSGTLIATNDENGTIKNVFDADLAKGEYLVLVENADTTYTSAIDYNIVTSLSSTGEILLDSGASVDSLVGVSAYSYVEKYSYMLKDGILHRMSNILESTKELYIGEETDSMNIEMFSYFDEQKNNEYTYISKIDLADSSQNIVALVNYDPVLETILIEEVYILNGLIDEEIMFIDTNAYIYYYDNDSLYISFLKDTDTSQQLALENLKSVRVIGDVMYLVTTDFVRMYDVSDKATIDSSKILDTINVANTQSIYIEDGSNRLFIGANDKIEVWNISDKTSATQLSSFDVDFIDNELYYAGTPTSMYILEGTLFTAIDEVGLVVFDVDSFSSLNIKAKALNLGEKFTSIYTYKGDALNYIVGDELKVYFLNDQVIDASTAGTYNLVESSSVKEGCFIATAAYGSYFDTNVKVLRDFRDAYLMHNELGRIFVDLYYENSPSIARTIVDNEVLKSLVRFSLTPIVYLIKYPVIWLFLMIMLFVLAYKKTHIKSTKMLGKI